LNSVLNSIKLLSHYFSGAKTNCFKHLVSEFTPCTDPERSCKKWTSEKHPSG